MSAETLSDLPEVRSIPTEQQGQFILPVVQQMINKTGDKIHIIIRRIPFLNLVKAIMGN